MLIRTQDDNGMTTYMVCNDAGTCLIFTTNGYMAQYIHLLSKGVDLNLRLTIGGDPGTRKGTAPIFHHVRRYNK
jgi:hypothetical protein